MPIEKAVAGLADRRNRSRPPIEENQSKLLRTVAGLVDKNQNCSRLSTEGPEQVA